MLKALKLKELLTLKHEYAEVNGIRMHYIREGKGDPIVFWHGTFLGWFQWRNYIAEFSKDHEVFAFDLRGYNLSSRPTDPKDYSPKIIVEDVRRLIEHLGLEKVTLVGNDNNGIPFIFASFHPECLKSFVAINVPHPTMMYLRWLDNSEQQEASQYVMDFYSPDAERMYSENNYEKLIKLIFEDSIEQGKVNEDLLIECRESWSQPGTLTAAFNYYRSRSPAALSQNPSKQRPTRALMVDVPTLLIWSGSHMFSNSLIEGLDEYIRDLTIKRVVGLNSAMHEDSEMIYKLIREFILENS